MPRAKKSKPTALATVTVRLFAADVEALRARAGVSGIPWHVQLRALVRAAMHSKRGIVS